MMFSDNADPINMFRIDRVTPFRLPSFLGLFGPMRDRGFHWPVLGIPIHS